MVAVNEYFQGIGEDKTHKKTIRGCGAHDIKEDLIESWRGAMDKDNLPETSDSYNLNEWPECNKNSNQGIQEKRRPVKKLCNQTSYPG
jgi:hypothetical protein